MCDYWGRLRDSAHLSVVGISFALTELGFYAQLQATNLETYKPRNLQTSKLTNLETYKPRNLQTSKLTNLETTNLIPGVSYDEEN
jgi:hypothetical protein